VQHISLGEGVFENTDPSLPAAASQAIRGSVFMTTTPTGKPLCPING